MARLIERTSILTASTIGNITYRVRDHAASRDFYMSLLGMRCVEVTDERSVLAFGSPARLLTLESGVTSGVRSFGFSINDSDEDELTDRLRPWGLLPRHNGKTLVISDPDAFTVELRFEDPIESKLGDSSSDVSAIEAAAFEAVAVNHISYKSRNYRTTRDFYCDLFGLDVVFEDGKKCSVAFGSPMEALYLTSVAGGTLPHIDHFAFSVANFELDNARSILLSAGYEPEDDGPYAWTIWDPDGFKVQICAENGVYPGARRDPFH